MNSRYATRCSATTVLPVPGPPCTTSVCSAGARTIASCSTWSVATAVPMRPVRRSESAASRAPSPTRPSSSTAPLPEPSSGSSSTPATRSPWSARADAGRDPAARAPSRCRRGGAVGAPVQDERVGVAVGRGDPDAPDTARDALDRVEPAEDQPAPGALELGPTAAQPGAPRALDDGLGLDPTRGRDAVGDVVGRSGELRVELRQELRAAGERGVEVLLLLVDGMRRDVADAVGRSGVRQGRGGLDRHGTSSRTTYGHGPNASPRAVVPGRAASDPRRSGQARRPERDGRRRGDVERVHSPAMGIVTTRSAASIAPRDRPSPSVPSTSASRSGGSATTSSRLTASSARASAATTKPSSRSRSRPPGHVSNRVHGTWNTVPMLTRTERR